MKTIFLTLLSVLSISLAAFAAPADNFTAGNGETNAAVTGEGTGCKDCFRYYETKPMNPQTDAEVRAKENSDNSMLADAPAPPTPQGAPKEAKGKH